MATFSRGFESNDLVFDGRPFARLIDKPIHPQCFISVVVPIRDEAENIVKTLESLSRQVDLQGCPLDPGYFEIIVLANNCRDNSVEIACQWQKQISLPHIYISEINLPKEDANVGFARRFLMNTAYRRLQTNSFKKGIIMTTDGDTQVAPDWIAAAVREVEGGADAVGGRIMIDPEELEKLDDKTRAFYLLDENYRLLAAEFEAHLDNQPHDAHPRHHQHFNGSFAVTTDAFEKAGGIPDVKFLEDIAFYNSLLRIDAKFRHSTEMRAFTSARNAGRTERGLSTQLNEWRIMGQNKDEYLVESAESLEKKFSARKQLRSIRQKQPVEKSLFLQKISDIAQSLCVPSDWLFEEIKKSPTCGVLFERIVYKQATAGEWNARHPLIGVEPAIMELEAKLKKFRLQTKALNKTA